MKRSISVCVVFLVIFIECIKSDEPANEVETYLGQVNRPGLDDDHLMQSSSASCECHAESPVVRETSSISRIIAEIIRCIIKTIKKYFAPCFQKFLSAGQELTINSKKEKSNGSNFSWLLSHYKKTNRKAAKERKTQQFRKEEIIAFSNWLAKQQTQLEKDDIINAKYYKMFENRQRAKSKCTDEKHKMRKPSMKHD